MHCSLKAPPYKHFFQIMQRKKKQLEDLFVLIEFLPNSNCIRAIQRQTNECIIPLTCGQYSSVGEKYGQCMVSNGNQSIGNQSQIGLSDQLQIIPFETTHSTSNVKLRNPMVSHCSVKALSIPIIPLLGQTVFKILQFMKLPFVSNFKKVCNGEASLHVYKEMDNHNDNHSLQPVIGLID